MHRIRPTWWPSCFVLIALVAGCAAERAPIDRVQPYALDKTFFVGEDLVDPGDNPEFWTQATLVDVGFGEHSSSLFTSSDAQRLARIRWQIAEDLLLARLAYERIEGTDGRGVGEKTDEGILVAAFKIDKHFDIVHDYNSTTGEKINVLTENDVDRPWYQRQYMRVDFSRNLVTDNYDFDTLSLIGVYDGIEYEPLAYYVDDPTHPDAPYFDVEGGYFDVTVKAFAKPLTVDLSHLGWGIDSFPACFLEYDFLSGSFPSGSCSPSELTIRHSFRRVEISDYEPLEWDGHRFQAYGGFYVERYGYSRNYGMSDALWHRFLTRYDLWERSHYYDDPETMTGPVECFTPETTPMGADPHRDENTDGTEDECAAVGRGSRCDTFRQRCTLPYRDRRVAPIPWYYAEDSNPEFFESTEISAHQWDVALRSAVATARYTECRMTGGKDCMTRSPVWTGQDDDNQDAMALALEVDDCRNGHAYPDRERDPDQCIALADELGAARGYAPGVVALAKAEELLVLCHSPVRFDDHAVCGGPRLPEGMTPQDCDAAEVELSEAPDTAGLPEIVDACRAALRVRRGDLRYNIINVISEPQSAAPWGIYMDSEDPLTGMKVATSVNVWSHVTDLWAQKVIDQIRYIKGELDTADVTEGDYVDDWARAVEAASGGGVFPRMSRGQVDRRLSEFAAGKALPMEMQAKEWAQAHPQHMAAARSLVQAFRGVRSWVHAASTWAPIYSARRKAAKGSPVEATLLNKMVQELHGASGLPLEGPVLERVSPFRAGSPTVARDLRRLKRVARAHRGGCLLEEAQAPMDMVGLADILEEKFGAFDAADSPAVQAARAERMRRFLAHRVHHGAMVHEMGHSIGMRHNFVGSADAWNYRPQYWQLRSKDGAVTTPCEDLSADGEGCVGPRYYDPVTPGERDNLIQMFMHSTVMEYPGETTQDMVNLGPYDFAAARIFYGDAVAVHADPSYAVGTSRFVTVQDKTDDFGGILGISHWFEDEELHYSDLQEHFDLISDCEEVDPALYRPARWDEERDGVWHPVLDGFIVQVDGVYTRCRQQPVDYVSWSSLRPPTKAEYEGWNPTVRTIDPEGRTRVPYGFATDSWSDLGNVSVYTNDNGADAYEIFNFLITQQEVSHIFDNYRRGRQEFSVRGAANRSLWRYNEKIRDGAKGLALMRNVYQDWALEEGYDFDEFWWIVAPYWFKDNIIASSLVFDHFTRLATRPEHGPHYLKGDDPVLRSLADPLGEPGETKVVIPNGATGRFGMVSAGGRPIENRYADDMGEYGFDVTVNAGSYYDKIHAGMLLTESVDNFISDTRPDFVDARYRAVSMADLFPEGFRRFLGNALTGDDFLKGPRLAADADGNPLLGDDGFPGPGIGWTSWWGETPSFCFPAEGTSVCAVYGDNDYYLSPSEPVHLTPLDPQIGWEEQKFLIAWTLLYLPENQQQWWLNQLRIWELGADADPGFDNRIELHHPGGRIYVAKTFGKEEIFGRTVQRGIGARVLEYANELMARAYVTTDGPDLDEDGAPDWVYAEISPETGMPVVAWDPAIEGEYIVPAGWPDCSEDDNSGCTCSDNRACVELERYVEIPFFIRQNLHAYELWDLQPDGIWD